jgi:hypothetical protein
LSILRGKKERVAESLKHIPEKIAYVKTMKINNVINFKIERMNLAKDKIAQERNRVTRLEKKESHMIRKIRET